MPSIHRVFISKTNGISRRYLVLEAVDSSLMLDHIDAYVIKGSGNTAEDALGDYHDGWTEGEYLLVKILPVNLVVEE